MPEFEVEVYTGCMNNAPAGQHFCKACNPLNLKESSLILQQRILGVLGSTHPGNRDIQCEVLFMVECIDPDTAQVFQAPILRAEVKAELLAGFEKGLLPNSHQHGNKTGKPA